MDNNLVSIDNLFKQRLEGGEEHERSGAWLQMQDLLEKEMPRNKRIGFLYWRKWITYTGILLLLVAGSIGGYEMSSAFRPAGNNSNSTPLASNTHISQSKANGTAVSTTTDKASNVRENVTTDNHAAPANGKLNKGNNSDIAVASSITPKNTATHGNIHNPSNDSHTGKSGTNSISALHESVAKDSHSIAFNTSLSAENANGNNYPTKKSVSSVPKTDDKNGSNSEPHVLNPVNGQWQALPLQGNTSLTYAKGVNKSGSDENGNAVVKHHKKNKKNTHQAVVSAPSNNPSQQGALASNDNTTPDAVTDNHIAGGPHVASGNISGATGNDAIVSGTRNKRSHTAMVKNKVAAMKSIADNTGKADSKNGFVVAKNHKQSKKNPAKPIAMNNLAIGGALNQPAATTPAKDNNANTGNRQTQLNKLTANTPKSAAHKSKTIGNTTALAVVTHDKKQGATDPNTGTGNATAVNNKHGNKHAGKDKNTSATNIQPAATAGVASVEQHVAKKVKTKIVRLENRYIKMSPSYGFYKMDTVSIDEIELPEDLKQLLANNTPAKGSSAQQHDDSTERNAVAEIYPNAAAAILAKPYTEKQPANTDYVKGESGSAAESLSRLFNEIKYNVNGVHLQAGLTGGINATFFGPAGMKGFNFGFQCNAEFNNTWSLLAQLVYFHRINTSYVINDNYSKYVQGSNGMYQKDSVSQTIGFATIHSFELPLAIQYSKENFIFSLGMNFAYTLPINIDEAPSQTTTMSGSYATAGKESAPKYNVNDFGARFGMGYLIGISYRVAPDVTINLRDVQTFWDNSSTQGAKTVSSQLYKNPSFQLSFGYTFGVKKEKK